MKKYLVVAIVAAGLGAAFSEAFRAAERPQAARAQEGRIEALPPLDAATRRREQRLRLVDSRGAELAGSHEAAHLELLDLKEMQATFKRSM